jgi:hypothetical protein
MGAGLLDGTPTVIAAPIIGATAGAATGAFLGSVAWPLVSSGFSPSTVAFFAVAGAVAGLVAATGTALLGVRTRFGLEWPVLTGTGTALALVVVAGTTRVAYLGLFAGVAAVTSWLMAHASRRLLATRLPRGPLTASVLAGYFLALAGTIILGIVLFATLIYLLNTWSLRRSLAS